MRVHAITTDRGGCWWFRVFLPLDTYARTYQVETSYGDGVPRELLDELSDRSDPGVLVAKFLQSAGPGRDVETGLLTPSNVEFWEQIARAPRRPLLVYDVDDSYYHVSDMYAGEHSVYADPEVVRRAERVMRACDVVTCSTPAVASLYERVNRNVVVLPNSVPESLLSLATDRRPPGFTIGYQCSPSHLHDIQWVTPALVAFLTRHRDARVHFYGPTEDVQVVKPVRPEQVQTTRWIDNLYRFHKVMSGAYHVGIAPIVPGRAFNAYKSGVKAQTYGALGIPSITGDTTYYRDVVRDGVTGFIARSPREFAARLEQLHKSPELLADMGQQAQLAESKRTIERRIDLWHKVYGGEKP